MSKKVSTSPKAIEGNAQLVTTPKLSPKLQAELSTHETAFEVAANQLHQKSNEMVYAMLRVGFRLLKIQAIHALSNQEVAQRPRKPAIPTVGIANGFTGWIKEQEGKISQSGAYRAINVALNAGLTETSTDKALDKVIEEKALDGIPLGDLCKKPKQLGTGSGKAEQLQLNLVGQTIQESAAVCEALVKLRGEMSADEFEVVCKRLEETLEELTGGEWDMVEAKPSKEARAHAN